LNTEEIILRLKKRRKECFLRKYTKENLCAQTLCL
jgi:hypothetical protein